MFAVEYEIGAESGCVAECEGCFVFVAEVWRASYDADGCDDGSSGVSVSCKKSAVGCKCVVKCGAGSCMSCGVYSA